MTIDFTDDPRGRELILMIERAKYERWLSQQVASMLSDAFNQVVDTILSPSFRSLSPAEQNRKFALFRELDRQLRTAYANVQLTVRREMQAYSQAEFDIGAEQVKAMLAEADPAVLNRVETLLSRYTVQSIADLPIQGLDLGEWFDAQANTMSRETRRILQNGLLQGKSTTEIVRQIVPPRLSLEPALYRRARNEGMTITRTTVTAVQNDAAIQSYLAAGPDISDSYRFVAVRDARTTAICRAADGKIFRNDDPQGLKPPLHMGCRSTVVPIVKDAFLTQRDQKGQPLTFASYNSWLRDQNGSTQDSILGAARAEWWRKGRMSLQDAVDQDNRMLTLAQLRTRLGVEQQRQRVAL